MNRHAPFLVMSMMLLVATPLAQARAQSPFDVQSSINRVEQAIQQIPRSMASRFARAGDYHPGWGVEFQPVPPLLRLHCPLVRSGQGLLIARIDHGVVSPLCHDLQAGDVLLAIDGQALFDVESLPELPAGCLRIMRAGEAMTIELRPESQAPRKRPQRRQASFEHARPFPAPASVAPASVASTLASGGESIAVAQQGDQITLEMSLPSLEASPIRFQGTRKEILQQLEASTLSPAAKQRVRQSLPGSRSPQR